MRIRLLALPLTVLVAVLAGCGSAPAEQEADLVVYSGRIEDLVSPLIEMFEEESGLDVDVRYGDSAELAATLIEEGENSPADVFFSQDAGSLGALQNEGLLAELPKETLGMVAPEFRSSEGDWVGVSARVRVVGYAREKLAEDALEASHLDYAEPEWKGRVGWAPTNASMQAQITAMRDRLGDDVVGEWLDAMVENDTQVYPDNISVRDAIANGEIEVGLLNHYYIAEAIALEGEDYPVAIGYLAQDDPGSLVNVAGAGEITGTARPDEAVQFIDFLLSEQAQTYFADETKEYPLVKGVDADPALLPLERVEQPDLDLSKLDDLRGTLDLMRQHGVL